MPKPNIYIRADGNAEIGLGHLVRCMALAYMLKDNFTIHFVCKYAPENIVAEFKAAGFLFTAIHNEQIFLSFINTNDLIVLDHYGLDSNYQKEIKSRGCKLICIDDLHDKEFFADLIINHAPGIKPSDYHAHSYTQYALGLDYVLLRPAFLEVAHKKKVTDDIQTVFICFGGADLKNLTMKALDVVLDSKKFKKIIIVCGAAYKYVEELQIKAHSTFGIELHFSVNEKCMIELMSVSDVAIVPASGILLEAISAGCSIISGMYIDNQIHLYNNYKKAEAFIDAIDFSRPNLEKSIQTLFEKKKRERPGLIDGLSGARLLKLFLQFNVEAHLTLRKAGLDDLDITFKWATEKKVRAFSFNQSNISLAEHTNWFFNKLKDGNCIYFIAQNKAVPIGSIRFELNDSLAVINYLIDPEFHNRGYGIVLLKKGIDELQHIATHITDVVGYVMQNNIASIKVFERMGFSKVVEGKNCKFIKSLNGNRKFQN